MKIDTTTTIELSDEDMPLLVELTWSKQVSLLLGDYRIRFAPAHIPILKELITKLENLSNEENAWKVQRDSGSVETNKGEIRGLDSGPSSSE